MKRDASIEHLQRVPLFGACDSRLAEFDSGP